MKRIIGFFITLILSSGVFTLIAQNETNVLREEIERNTMADNWFIAIGGDLNLLLAEQDGFTSWSERLKLGVGFTVGKWFNPDFGARFQIKGGALRGFNDINPYPDGYYIHPGHQHVEFPIGGVPDPNVVTNYNYATKSGILGFWQDFNYASFTFDGMINLTNLLRGYHKPNSPVDIIPFVGLGMIKAFNNNVTTPSFYWGVAKVGLHVDINISENLSIFGEIQGNATEREFDGYVGTAIGDGMLNFGGGIQFAINKRFNTLSNAFQLTADEIDRLNKKINDNRYLIDNIQDNLDRQQSLLDRLERCCDEGKAKDILYINEQNDRLPTAIHFSLNSYRLDQTANRKIAAIADYLRRNSSSRLLLIGYADRKTGTPNYNWNLSQRRVETVAYELRRYGVASNRLLIEWKGDREQPFPQQNDLNRVVMLVEKW